MVQEITERDLRERSDEIVRALERGESFLLAHNGTLLGELVLNRSKYFVPTEKLQAALADLPPVDFARFRADVDAFVDQDPTPRA